MANAEKEKRIYHAKKAVGLCVDSGCQEHAAPGRARCEKHLRRFRIGSFSKEEQIKRRLRDNELYHIKKLGGRCVVGHCSSLALPGFTTCQKHKDYNIKKHQDFKALIRTAMYRGIPATLSETRFNEIKSNPCFFCNIEGDQCSNKIHRGKEVYITIDRLDNTQGYTDKNCVGMCEHHNRTKNSVTPQMVELLYKTYKEAGILSENMDCWEESPWDAANQAYESSRGV